jgi:hypothetical protein
MDVTSPKLTFEYQATEKDFVTAALSACRKGSMAKLVGYYLLPLLGWGSIGFASVLIVLSVRDGNDWKPLLAIFAIGVVWLLLYYIKPWRLKRAFRKDPRFKAPIKISIDGSEWSIKSATADAHYRRRTFIKAVEMDSLFLFYHSPLMFNFIPKHALTADQLAGIHEFLNRELPVRKGKAWLPGPVS